MLAGHVPLNDPFGGWVYWDQLPSLAIRDVEVVRGGASDLYGNSAIGGVINMIERQPGPTAYAVDAGYGGENTPHAAVLGTTARGPWSGLAAADWLRTDGYIEVAPAARGPVDTAANVHYQNGELDGRRTFAERGDAYLRGNVLNEARGNGTPLQHNRTRLWRYTGGTDWTTRKCRRICRAVIRQPGTLPANIFVDDRRPAERISHSAAASRRATIRRLCSMDQVAPSLADAHRRRRWR